MRLLGFLAVVAALLPISCYVPGTNEAAQGYRCASAPDQRPPGPASGSFEPVWRTYRDSKHGFEISLPMPWEGLVLNPATAERDLGDIQAHSPVAAADLRRGMQRAGPGVHFVGIDSQAIVEVGDAVDGPGPLVCAASVVTARTRGLALEGLAKRARAHLPGGDVDEFVSTYRTFTTGQAPELRELGFILPGPTAHHPLLVRLRVREAMASQYEPLFWRIAGAVRAGELEQVDVNPTSTCMYADVLDTTSDVPRGSCPFQLGAPVLRVDCVPLVGPARPTIGVGTYDSRSKAPLSIVPTSASDRGCTASLPAGVSGTVPLGEDRSPNLVVAVDFRASFQSDSGLGIVVRATGGEQTYVYAAASGQLVISEISSGGVSRILPSEPMAFGPHAAHRLILSANGRELRAALDGATSQPVTAMLQVHPGGVQVYFGGRAATTAMTVDLLRLTIYEQAPGNTNQPA